MSDLLAGIGSAPPPADPIVSGLCADSREVSAGDLFFARPGIRTDGARYIDDAIAAGAVAVVRAGDADGCGLRGSVPEVTVTDLPHCMGVVSDRWFGHPSRGMRVVGVTGTNGKTSVSHLVAQVLHGIPDRSPSAVVGTLGYGVCGALATTTHTTPDVIVTHRILADLAERGVRHVVMEVSSHGLEQGRVASVEFDVAVFTNLSRDHLDYHGDQAAYVRAKRRLWEEFDLDAAVVNADDPVGRSLLDNLPADTRAVSFGLEPAAPRPSLGLEVRGEVIEVSPAGTRLRIHAPRSGVVLASRLVGRINAYNLMAALATLLSLDVAFDAAIEGLAAVDPLPGRMQVISPPGPDRPTVFIDFAHTPDALTRVLDTLREIGTGRLWCVFGCGGDRDRGKRPQMGEIAARKADRVVVTSDNPRGEARDAIIDEIVAGIPESDDVIVEPDRGRAIGVALAAAGPGDTVLIAGKGHEAYQEEGGVRRPFSDAACVGAAFEAGES